MNQKLKRFKKIETRDDARLFPWRGFIIAIALLLTQASCLDRCAANPSSSFTALQYFASKLGGMPKMMVVANASHPGTSSGVRILPASIFLSVIP